MGIQNPKHKKADPLHLGNGKWAAKVNKLLGYKIIHGRYFEKSFDFSRASTTTRVNKSGYVEDVAAHMPRIDYATSPEGALLIEKASENAITYPISFDNPYWTKNNASITSGHQSPKLGGSAFKLVEDTSNGEHSIVSPSDIPCPSNKNNAFSIYAKKGERKWIAFNHSFGTKDYSKCYAWFDLENGVWGESTKNPSSNYLYNLTSVSLANGWYRISLTGVSGNIPYTGLPDVAEIRICSAISDGEFSYQGDGTSGIYIAYAQLENSHDEPTALMIPTSEGTSASRVADSVGSFNLVQDFSYTGTQGVLFLDAEKYRGTNGHITLNDGDINNQVKIHLQSHRADNYCTVEYTSNGVTGWSTYSSVIMDNRERHKYAFRWQNGDWSLWIDGKEMAAQESSTTMMPFNTLTQLEFKLGGNHTISEGNEFYGKIHSIKVADFLEDEEVAALTDTGKVEEEEGEEEEEASGGYYYYNGEPGFDGIGLVNL